MESPEKAGEPEQTPADFDLDREFGEGTKKRLSLFLEDAIRDSLERNVHGSAAAHDFEYRVLFGKSILDKDAKKLLDGELEQTTRRDLAKKRYLSGARYGAVPHLMLSDRIFWSKAEHVAMAKALEDKIKPGLVDMQYDLVAHNAVDYLILTGSKCWRNDVQGHLAESVAYDLRRWLAEKNYLRASEYAARLRLLRAKDLIFTENGVEIIENQPNLQAQETTPEEFDIDQEFGPGTYAFLEKASRDWIQESLARKSTLAETDALRTAVAHPILFGERFWGKDDDERMKKELERMLQLQIGPTRDAEVASEYLLLYGNRSWGDEKHQEMTKNLKKRLEEERGKIADTGEMGWAYDLRDAVEMSVFYRLLSGENYFGKEDSDLILKAAKVDLQHLLPFAVTDDRYEGYRVNAVRKMLYYHVLKAQELQYTGEGVKIIDNPPETEDNTRK